MIVAIAIVAAAVLSAAWVLFDATRRGLPRRKALTWTALQLVEWPLFLWFYRRIRPRAIRDASD